jgi:Integrase core domain
MPWRWGYGPVVATATTPATWSTTPTAACSIWRSATQRLAEAGAVASVGSKGDSYDNAMAEAFNSLFKAELVRNRGPWRSIDDLEIAVAEYIDWYNHRRLHGETGLIPPVEYEDLHRSHPPPSNPLRWKSRPPSKPVLDTYKGQLDLERHGGHTPAGVAVRVLQRILALTAVIWHNDHTAQPVRRSLIAYDH